MDYYCRKILKYNCILAQIVILCLRIVTPKVIFVPSSFSCYNILFESQVNEKRIVFRYCHIWFLKKICHRWLMANGVWFRRGGRSCR